MNILYSLCYKDIIFNERTKVKNFLQIVKWNSWDVFGTKTFQNRNGKWGSICYNTATTKELETKAQANKNIVDIE